MRIRRSGDGGSSGPCPEGGRGVAEGAALPPPGGIVEISGGWEGAGKPFLGEKAALGEKAGAVAGTYPGPFRMEKGNGRRWRTVAALMVAALVVLAGAVMGTLVYRAKEAPYDVVREYIEALNVGDAERAIALLHPESELRAGFDVNAERNRLAPSGTAALQIRDARAAYLTGSRASIRVEMGGEGENPSLKVFKLSREDGGWHIVTYENL